MSHSTPQVMTTTISSRDRPRASRQQLRRRRSASPDPPAASSHPPNRHLLPPLTHSMDHSRSLPSGLDEFGSVPFTAGDAAGSRPPAPRRQPSPLTVSRQPHNGRDIPAPGEIRRDLFGCTPFTSQPPHDAFGAAPFVTCTQNT